MTQRFKSLLLGFITKRKATGLDLSKHRVYTTRYEDLCM